MQEIEIPIIRLWSLKSLEHFGGYPCDLFNRAAFGCEVAMLRLERDKTP